MSAERVPPALRAVLEALRDAARWMHFGAERVVEGGPSPITKQHAAWLELDSCCVAALAADAGARMGPMTGKPMPCPNCGAIRHEHDAHFCAAARGASSAAAPSPEYIVRHPNGHLMAESTLPYVPTEAEEAAALTSLAKASPVLAQHATHIDGEFDLALTAVRRMFATWRDRAKAGAAPDAELDRLLEDYGEEWGERARMQVGWTEGDLARSVAIIAEYRAAIHAHVARVTQEARQAGREAAAREFANDQGLVWREKGGA